VTADLEDPAGVTKFLVRDRDTKYISSCGAVFGARGPRILKTPFRTPNANAYAERFVRTIHSECLDQLLLLNEHQLMQVLRSYVQHYG
jgi:transposase InsO family protein